MRRFTSNSEMLNYVIQISNNYKNNYSDQINQSFPLLDKFSHKTPESFDLNEGIFNEVQSEYRRFSTLVRQLKLNLKNKENGHIENPKTVEEFYLNLLVKDPKTLIKTIKKILKKKELLNNYEIFNQLMISIEPLNSLKFDEIFKSIQLMEIDPLHCFLFLKKFSKRIKKCFLIQENFCFGEIEIFSKFVEVQTEKVVFEDVKFADLFDLFGRKSKIFAKNLTIKKFTNDCQQIEAIFVGARIHEIPLCVFNKNAQFKNCTFLEGKPL